VELVQLIEHVWKSPLRHQ